MFPYVTFLKLDLYNWFTVIGIVAAFAVFRIYADKIKIPVRLQNVCFIFFIVAVLIGFGCTVLFQAVYNAAAGKGFHIDDDTGMTFYGGLIGGAAVFLTLYFTLGRKFCKGDIPKYFQSVSSIAACAIALGHGFGRIGCLMAGCCYGRETTSSLGIFLPAINKTVIPTQLFEAIFLFLLFAALSVVLFKTRFSGLGAYLLAYGIFRFLIEFLRDDDRGSFIPFMSPSQAWSVLLIALGLAYVIYFIVQCVRKRKEPTSEVGGQVAESESGEN